MHGRKEFKSDFPFLKNEYANQLKDNRAVKKCRKKGFHIILTLILITFTN